MLRDLDSFQHRVFDIVVLEEGFQAPASPMMPRCVACRWRSSRSRILVPPPRPPSSKLLHGGIRYLQQLRPDKVRESAIERCRFQRIAPHLTCYVPFLIPTFRGLVKGRMALQGALLAHELICAGQNAVIRDPSKRVPRSRCCTKAETLALAPVLTAQRDLTGACLLYESHMHSSERMTLAFLKSAAGNGAVVGNYVSAQRLVIDGGVVRGVVAHDELGGGSIEIRARLIVNAAGPWIPGLNHTFGVAGLTRNITRFSKGVHIVTRPLTHEVALALTTPKRQRRVIDRGGRHLFVIPWRQRSLIGTTNVPFDEAPDGVRATAQDAVDFVTDINDALPGANLSLEDVQHAFAGLYPLTEGEVLPDVYQVTGNHQVVDHGALGDVDGIVSVLGMKFTTARRVAELAMDLIVGKLGVPTRTSRTATTSLVGGDIEHLPSFVAGAIARHRHRVDPQIVQHLIEHYGTEADAVLAATAPGLRPTSSLSPRRECIESEIAFAVTHEMALHLDDVVLRRTGLGSLGHPGIACLYRCGEIMASLLGWSDSRLEEEVDRTGDPAHRRRPASHVTARDLPGSSPPRGHNNRPPMNSTDEFR